MAVRERTMAILDSQIIANSNLFIRDLLIANVTDPQTGKRGTNESFVMTSYPSKPVHYPIITVKNTGFSARRSGMNTEEVMVALTKEIRVWARAEDSKDQLTDNVINVLRTEQQDADGTINEQLHDFEVTSVVPVDEEGASGIKSAVISVTYNYPTGQ